MARQGFLKRVLGGIRSFFGGGTGEEPAPPPSIPTQPPIEYYPPQPPPPDYGDYYEPPQRVELPPEEQVTEEDQWVGGGIRDEDQYECDVRYIGAHRTGKVNVLPRWKVGGYGQHLERSDVKCILDEIGYKQRYVVLITGVTEDEYPGKEDSDVVTLSFPLDGADVWDALEHQDTQTPEDWINTLLYGYQVNGKDVQWDEVQGIDILDR